MKPPPIVILTGPNGVGKGTISKLLITERSLNLERFVRHTTRAQGAAEIDMVDYNFVPQAEFDEMEAQGEFIHVIRKPFGSYGETKQHFENTMRRGKVALFELAFDSAQGLTTALAADGFPVCTIFVSPKEVLSPVDIESGVEILRSRMTSRGRGESPTDLEQRLSSARDWLASPPRDSHIVINKDGEIEIAAARIRQIISQTLRA